LCSSLQGIVADRRRSFIELGMSDPSVLQERLP
jgi:hypothetical protein